MMSCLIDCCKMVRLIGAMIFIGKLLLMAGIEPNPGPADKVFTFRYQYLLIEVGTSILRKLFDYQVGADFKQYLDNHPVADRQLQFLINKGKISAEQQQLIPPVDNKPLSSNFDITLLCCLLRNACGLRVYIDKAWTDPLSTDTSVEANVSRLRDCRNKLMHSGSVFDSETDLTAKWDDLCLILTAIDNVCGFANLQSLIHKAETVDIDEKLKDKFDKMMSKWDEMDRLFDRVLGEVVSKVDQYIGRHEILERKIETIVIEQKKTNTLLVVEQTQKGQKRSYVEEMTDIRAKLTDVYLASCSRLTMSPLFKDENKELLKIYRTPSLFVIDYHKAENHQKTTEVTSCEDIFYKDQQPCKNIYITGDAGVGKSSFCMYLSLLWSKSKLGHKMNNDRMQKDADFLAKFDYLFYVTLRDTDRTDVIAMIVDQLFNTECDDKWNKTYQSVDNILKCEESLVILDGLDEWRPEQRDFQRNIG